VEDFLDHVIKAAYDVEAAHWFMWIMRILMSF